MKYQNPVDFESYYFFELIESIKKQGSEKYQHELQQKLDSFVNFMMREDTPLQNIEKLAHLQGTSDISIFFSDILEQIRDYSPEEAVARIKEQAGDFLEIFGEIVKDPQWEKSVAPQLFEKPEPQVESFSLFEFIHKEATRLISDHLNKKSLTNGKIIESLFDRISSDEKLEETLQDYRNRDEMSGVISCLEKIYQHPKDKSDLENFVKELYTHVDELAHHIEELVQEHPELWEAFATGEKVPAPSELKEEEEFEEMVESAEKFDRREAEKTKLSEEDQHLRWLLRDYIIHEIEELTSELVQKYEKLSQDSADKTTSDSVLEILKVLKDLGQIHNYPAIEQISGEIHLVLKKNFQENQPITGDSVEVLREVCNEFVGYVDAVLNDSEQESFEKLRSKKQRFVDSLLTVAPSPPLEEHPFKKSEELVRAFSDVNTKFTNELYSSYRKYVTESEDQDEYEKIIRVIEHLDNWYEIWELPHAKQFLEIFASEIQSSEVAENLEQRKSLFEEGFKLLSQKLFTADDGEWKKLFSKLEGREIAAEELKITESIEAFKDVTARHFELIKNAFLDYNLKNSEVFENYFIPVLQQISSNSALIEHQDFQYLCNYLNTKMDLFLEGTENFPQDFRKSFAEKLDLVIENVNGLPDRLPIDDMIHQFEKLIEQKPEEIKAEDAEKREEDVQEEISEDRETYIDEELTNVFKTEAKKYLEEIETYLSKLESNIEDNEALRKLGNIIHTLKGSAQMLNQNEIANLARPLENMVDLVLEDQLALTENFVPLFKNSTAAISRKLDDETTDSQDIINSINDYIDQNTISEEKEEVPEEVADEETAEDVIEEIASEESQPETEEAEQISKLKLSEKDPELLEIFRSEALNNLETIEEDFTLIEKFTHDKKTLQSLDQAVHEVRAAAKMLGFAEVGSLLDDLERVVEIVNSREPDNWDQIIPTMRKAVQVVRDLTETHEVSQKDYDDTKESISDILSELTTTYETEEKEEPVTEEKPTEEMQKVLEPSTPVMQAFIQEAREYLEDINFLLMKMEKSPDNDELSYHLMRSLHTLKGSAGMVYLDSVEKLAHLSEDLVEKFREKNEGIPQNAFDLMFEVVDEIEFIVDAIAKGMRGKVKNYEEIVERLNSYHREFYQVSEEETEAEAEKDEKVEPEAEPETTTKSDEDKEYLSVTEEVETEEDKPRDAYVRLHVDQMDNMLNEAAELVINHTQFKTQLDKFKNYLPRLDMESKNLQNILWYLDTIMSEERRIEEMIKPYVENLPSVEESQKKQIENIQRAIHNLNIFFDNFKQVLQGFKESGKLYEEQVHKITRLSTQIHEEIMAARMVPIAILFQRFQRPLRDLARKHQKKIKLYMEGENTELDRVLIEKLYEPILHILRNAIDHGIEPPSERKKNGKSEEGLIKIIASQERNFVNIEIQDDGAGIDVDRVKNRAIELGYLEADQAEELTRQEIFEFLMYPGFSTTESTTELSGRGVGLDVVKSQIQKIKGDIRVTSEAGKETHFLIRVPISLTVTQAMLVEVSEHVYAIPLLQVEETTNIRIKDLDLRDDVYYMRQRGGYIPVLYMANLLQIKGAKRHPVSVVGEYPVIIVQDEGHRVALLVDKIVHREEILIKSLGPSLQRVQFITGGSILADGKVVLVLDVPQIVRETIRMKKSGAALQPDVLTKPETERPQEELMAAKSRRQKKAIKGRKASVLVVDDSLSIRKFLSGLLSQKGFAVEMAKNGYNALEKMNQQPFDLVITDLEMPQLSGYELIEQIRSESRWDEMPIIVLTGRASKHIHQLTMNLGADEFIIKPFKENELLEKIDSFVEMG